MPNNRLYLRDTETGKELLLAKGWSSGWQVFGDVRTRLEEFLSDKDLASAMGVKNKCRLRIVTENDDEYSV